MLRSGVFRVLAACLGFGAGFSAPALALAHGHAHETAAEFAQHRFASGVSRVQQPAVDAADHNGDHVHLRVDASYFSRLLATGGAAIPSSPFAAGFADTRRASAAVPSDKIASPPDQQGGAAGHSRAPPTL